VHYGGSGSKEERDVPPDVRTQSDPGLTSQLGGSWITFHAEHRAARLISQEDVHPKVFVHDIS
jgi:hypothetical protein